MVIKLIRNGFTLQLKSGAIMDLAQRLEAIMDLAPTGTITALKVPKFFKSFADLGNQQQKIYSSKWIQCHFSLLMNFQLSDVIRYLTLKMSR